MGLRCLKAWKYPGGALGSHVFIAEHRHTYYGDINPLTQTNVEPINYIVYSSYQLKMNSGAGSWLRG